MICKQTTEREGASRSVLVFGETTKNDELRLCVKRRLLLAYLREQWDAIHLRGNSLETGWRVLFGHLDVGPASFYLKLSA